MSEPNPYLKSTAETNPYLPPSADLVNDRAGGNLQEGSGYFVERKKLYCRDGAVLPNRCVLTNEPIPPVQLEPVTVYWVNQAIFLFILLGLLPVIIAYYIARKKGSITYGFSHDTQKKNSRLKLFGGLGFVASLIATIFGIGNGIDPLGLTGVIGVVASLIALSKGGRKLRVIRATRDGYLQVKGASRAFIQSIAIAPVPDQ